MGIPYLLHCVALVYPSFGGNGVANLVGDASSCRPCAEADNSRVFQFDIADMKPGHQGSKSNAACSLDIVVEAGYLGAVLVEDAFGILEPKVLAKWSVPVLYSGRIRTSGYMRWGISSVRPARICR